MNIEKLCNQRKITELLHFTTNKGLIGILSLGKLLPRNKIKDEDKLEYILKYNAKFRKDTAWLDYVNLSISKINHEYFNYSDKWHEKKGFYWAIVSIDAKILTDSGVYFTTTNNIYPNCKRGKGANMLARLFAASVQGKFGKPIERKADHPAHWTTCVQAEVLYPGPLSAKYIQRIYVQDAQSQDAVNAQIAAIGGEQIDVVIAPDKFNDSGVST